MPLLSRVTKLGIQRELVHVSNAVNLYRFTNNLVGVFIPLIVLQSGGTLAAANSKVPPAPLAPPLKARSVWAYCTFQAYLGRTPSSPAFFSGSI